MALDDLTVEGAHHYLRRLRHMELSRPSPAFRSAVDALGLTLERAIQKQDELTPDDITYNAGLYTALLTTGEWRYLDNQWDGGLGSPAPRVIALGTEAANNPFTDMAWKSGDAILTLKRRVVEGRSSACAGYEGRSLGSGSSRPPRGCLRSRSDRTCFYCGCRTGGCRHDTRGR